MLITDPADPRLDDIRNLNKSDKSGQGLVIAEGPLVVSRLAESRFPMRCLVGFPNKLDQGRRIRSIGAQCECLWGTCCACRLPI